VADILFATQSYKSDSLALSAQRCINAYAEFQPPSAKSQSPVFGCPGIASYITVGNGPIRGMFDMDGVPYVVSGPNLYTFNAAGTVTQIGSSITGSSVVSMAGNGVEIAIANGVNGFIYNIAAGTFVQISDGDFHAGAQTVTYIDGYFVFDWSGTGKFFLSNLLAGTSYSALDFATAESAPDDIMTTSARSGLLVVFGAKTIEFWDHTGASSFPFRRVKGSTINRGIAGPKCKADEDNGSFFLGEDRVFYRLQGSTLQKASTHALEKEWETYSTISDAFCFPMSFGGHKFIYLTFPTEGTTFGYDLTTQLWHERQSYDPSGNEVKWRANAICAAHGFTYIGDANSNKVGKLSNSTYTEFGDPMIMTLTAPVLHGAGLLTFMPYFELDMQTGVGLLTGQGSDPHIMLDWSDDGGRSFVGPQLWRSLGALGVGSTRLQWDALGSFYNRAMRVSISDPVQRVLIAARARGLHTEPD